MLHKYSVTVPDRYFLHDEMHVVPNLEYYLEPIYTELRNYIDVEEVQVTFGEMITNRYLGGFVKIKTATISIIATEDVEENLKNLYFDLLDKFNQDMLETSKDGVVTFFK
jgi:hypothetical protein